jgi:tetratricopeptide (TPR) repeat protein
LADPSRLLTNNVEIAVAYAELAQRRGDLNVACERWARVRAANPYFQAGYREAAERLFEAERHVEADAVLRSAIERFPDEIWPLRNFARMAHDRRDWAEAAARLDAFHQRFPNDGAGFFVDAEAIAEAKKEAARGNPS